MVVSKPVLATCATLLSELPLGPPRTRQADTWVAPFQLAYSVTFPDEGADTASGASRK
jgi:hypothetical protein